MTNLRAILNDYQNGERGLPDFRECCEIVSYINNLEIAVKESMNVIGAIRATFESDCI